MTCGAICVVSVEVSEDDSHNWLFRHLFTRRKVHILMDILKRSHLFKRSSDLPGDLAALESVNDDDALISLQHDAVCQPVTNRHINILPNFQHLLLVELVAVL